MPSEQNKLENGEAALSVARRVLIRVLWYVRFCFTMLKRVDTLLARD